jgi:transcriptional regulator with XRE-family HTH domain
MLLRLKVAFLKKQVSQKDLCRKIGISETRLSRIIRGHARAHARERRLIARELGVREAEIFPRRRAQKRSSHVAQAAGQACKVEKS